MSESSISEVGTEPLSDEDLLHWLDVLGWAGVDTPRKPPSGVLFARQTAARLRALRESETQLRERASGWNEHSKSRGLNRGAKTAFGMCADEVLSILDDPSP